MSVLRAFYATKLGRTTTIAFGAASSVATPMLVDVNNVALEVKTPLLCILLATQNCFVRQGASDVGAATSSHWPIIRNVYLPVIIESPRDLYIRVIRDTTDGTLYMAAATELA